MTPLHPDLVRRLVRTALEEDVGAGDVTTLSTVPETTLGAASMVAREPLVLAGLDLAEAAFHSLSADLRIVRHAADGETVAAQTRVMTISGPVRPLLTAERVALNFVQRLSGIATLTAQFVAQVAGTRAQILDTRKTIPGLRVLEKYAVACGGGRNHRFGLFDQVLIKDNHLAALRGATPNPAAAAIRQARAAYPHLKIEIEADTLEQVEHAVAAQADIILLDNMPPAQLLRAVQIVSGRALTEASGGVNLATVRTIAATGVDFISVGALTHSARAVDLGLDFECSGCSPCRSEAPPREI